MNIELTTKNNLSIAVITGGEKRITDPAAALDLAMTARYETGSSRLAMWGNYPRYTSKPLQDFIRESNRGSDFFFTPTRQEAIDRLSLA